MLPRGPRAQSALLAAAGFLVLTTPISRPERQDLRGPAWSRLVLSPLDASEARPGTRLGALRFRRGWSLASDDRRFGGISAMQVDRGHLRLVSDAGAVFRFALPDRARTLPLFGLTLGSPGGRLKTSYDAEALVVAGETSWIAFESLNSVARFRNGRLDALVQPPMMRDWRGNSGPEAMIRLPSGEFLVFAEGRSSGAFSPVLLFARDPAERGARARAFRYRRPPGFRVTDAARLPDGSLLLLNRRVSLIEGVSARLVQVSWPPRGTLIEGRTIAVIAAPFAVDNLEALAVSQENGRTIVRLASDDNFMAFQRTLLLEFELLTPRA